MRAEAAAVEEVVTELLGGFILSLVMLPIRFKIAVSRFDDKGD